MKNDDKIALAAEIAMFAMSTECSTPIAISTIDCSMESELHDLDKVIKSVYQTLDDLEEK